MMDSGEASLSKTKLRSMRFVKQMFVDRDYLTEKQRIVFDQSKNIWQIFTETKDHQKVMAVFADCKTFGEGLQMEDTNDNDIKSNQFQQQIQSKTLSSQNMGMDVIKTIVTFAKGENIKLIILITDFLTPHALKHLPSIEDIRITHFNYDETGVEHMANHDLQPVKFQALSKGERKLYIKSHPLYQTELTRYPVDDALVKYYGFKLDDIIYIEDNDRQSGEVQEYGLVVEDI